MLGHNVADHVFGFELPYEVLLVSGYFFYVKEGILEQWKCFLEVLKLEMCSCNLNVEIDKEIGEVELVLDEILMDWNEEARKFEVFFVFLVDFVEGV
jgi:hypothetical protein